MLKGPELQQCANPHMSRQSLLQARMCAAAAAACTVGGHAICTARAQHDMCQHWEQQAALCEHL
jgi:hypothetical protein